MGLPDFPTDDTTLDMLMLAIDGGEGSERSSVSDLLELMSQMGGSDTTAVAEVIPGNPLGLDIEDAEIHVMRDPVYHEHDVLRAFIAEIRRLRGQ